MARVSRLSLARRLLRDAERADLPEHARAALLAAACSVAWVVVHDTTTPLAILPALTDEVGRAVANLERPRAVH